MEVVVLLVLTMRFLQTKIKKSESECTSEYTERVCGGRFLVACFLMEVVVLPILRMIFLQTKIT